MTRHTKPPMRSGKPIVNFKDSGAAEVLCPFCDPPHPLAPGVKAACGTELELRVSQRLYRNVVCVLCEKKGGTLVKIRDMYKHVHNCAPGRRLYTEPPEPSRSAALFWPLPNFMHRWHLRRTGRVVVELRSEGKVTGYGWENAPLERIQQQMMGSVPDG